jgi:hypothetical protein
MPDEKKLGILKASLRIWGLLGYAIFIPLFFAFMFRASILDVGGSLNWSIWNGVMCGDQPCHVPPMLFVIYISWATFALLAARDPQRYASFLDFTMWANFAHAGLMTVQALSMSSAYWSKFFTDIPYIGLVSVVIFYCRTALRRSSVVAETF